jgi:3-methyladenine DNA glycosylase AlkD
MFVRQIYQYAYIDKCTKVVGSVACVEKKLIFPDLSNLILDRAPIQPVDPFRH